MQTGSAMRSSYAEFFFTPLLLPFWGMWVCIYMEHLMGLVGPKEHACRLEVCILIPLASPYCLLTVFTSVFIPLCRTTVCVCVGGALMHAHTYSSCI